MNDSDNRISPSLFALKKVSNLPREPIEALKARILERYKELLAQESMKATSAPKAPNPA
jgi:hypothetical protein